MLKRLKRAKKLTKEESGFLQNLLSQNKPVFLHVIKLMTGDLYNTLGEECLSELYCLSVRKIDKLMSLEYPNRWLITASKYISLEMIRIYNKRRDIIPLSEVADNLIKDDVFEEAHYNIWMEQLAFDEIGSKLTKRQKQIYDMMIIKKMTCKEVSQELNISESTVWNTRAAVVKKMKEIIKNDLF